MTPQDRGEALRSHVKEKHRFLQKEAKAQHNRYKSKQNLKTLEPLNPKCIPSQYAMLNHMSAHSATPVTRRIFNFSHHSLPSAKEDESKLSPLLTMGLIKCESHALMEVTPPGMNLPLRCNSP